MPKAFAEKAQFYTEIMEFLGKKGGAGAKNHEILEHMRTSWRNVQMHQITHALQSLLSLKRVTRWKGQGRGDTWVSVAAQNAANEAVKVGEQPPVSISPLPGLEITLYESTGKLRIKYGKLDVLLAVEE